MANFVSEFVDGEKNILIPALQRDYVQGERKDIINPFIDELHSALKGEKTVDLNYIYGSREGDKNSNIKYFVPIDGQQRLITLWLLHLYLYSKLDKEFPVALRFYSREFANDFSEKLAENLKNTNSNVEDLKSKIIDSPWFVKGWINDRSVNNMLNTLEVISKSCQNPKDYQKFENITFSFLDMKEKGLTDDIYVKMNGRGRPLSYFENLKSFMDEQVVQKIEWEEEEYRDFAKDWQTKMDNEWTDFFWKNRNKNQEHPEEIDDEQLRLFYSLLLIYWSMHKENLRKDFSETERESLCSFLNVENDSDFKENSNTHIFKILLEGKNLIPLYWIEKLALFNKDVIIFIHDSLDVLNNLPDNFFKNKKLPKLYLSSQKDGNEHTPSLIYQISMETATYERTIPYLYMLICTPEKCKETQDDFNRWCRLIRNLIVNKSIDRDNIGDVCESIKKISLYLNENWKNSFYVTLCNYSFNGLTGFFEDQLQEESDKIIYIAKHLNKEEVIKEAEEYAFFKGAIRFLFQDVEEKVTEESWKDFDKKWENAQKYFDAGGVVKKYCKNAVLLRSFVSKFNRWEDFWNISYDNTSNTWRTFLLSEKYKKPMHDLLLKRVKLNEDFSDYSSLFNDDSKDVQDDLVKTTLLVSISEQKPILHWYYPVYCLYPKNAKADTSKWVVGNRRNKILSTLFKQNKIKTVQRIDGCDFFWGWNVEFEYKGSTFLWRFDKKLYKWNEKTETYPNTGKNVKNILDITTAKEFTELLDGMCE